MTRKAVRGQGLPSTLPSHGPTRRPRPPRGQDHRVQARSVVSDWLPARGYCVRQHRRGDDPDRFEDRSRHVVGVGNPLELEERAANLISDSISPRLIPEIELLCYRDTHVLAVGTTPWKDPRLVPGSTTSILVVETAVHLPPDQQFTVSNSTWARRSHSGNSFSFLSSGVLKSVYG